MKPNIFLRGRQVLLFLLALSLGLAECPGEDTNSFPYPLQSAEPFVWNQLTNRQAALTNQEFIDLSASINASLGTNRTVRGKFLEWLLTQKGKPLPHDGLGLKNAVIAGPVDLSNVEVPVPVRLVGCHFTNVNLSGAHFNHDLSFAGCLFDGQFHASALRVDGSLEFKTYYLTNQWETPLTEAPPDVTGLTNYLGTNETIQSWSPGHGKFILDPSRVTRIWVIEDSRTNRTSAATNQWQNYFEATALGDGLFLVQRYDDAAAQASNSVMNLTVGPLTKQWQMVTNTGLLDLNSVRTNLATAPGKILEFIGVKGLATMKNLEVGNLTNVLATNDYLQVVNLANALAANSNFDVVSSNLLTIRNILETNVLATNKNLSVVSNTFIAIKKMLEANLANTLMTSSNLEFIQANVLTPSATNSAVSVCWWFDNTNNPASLLVAKWDAGNQTTHSNEMTHTIQTNQIVTFSQPTIFRQGVWLDRAMIAGKLDAGEVGFRDGLYAHGLKVGDDLVMSEARFDAAANFIYAQIGHDFALQNSSFNNFDATGMGVGGSLIIDGGRFSNGARFEEVSVGKAFKGQHVRFENRNALAEFRGLKVDGSVDFLRAQFAGPANFILSHIKGNFQAHGATFEDDHSFQELQRITRDSFTFNTDFGSMQVDGFAIFENVLFARSVSFRNAQFGNFYLDGTHWPEPGILANYTDDPGTNDLLRLEGMDFQTVRDVTSGHFLHTPAQLKESQLNLLAMFKNRSPYSFDIYAKLESFFRREGAPALADEVFVHAKKREGIETRSLSLAWFANKFLDVTVGYGRKPLRAFVESLAVIGLWAVLCRFYMVKKKSPGQRPDWGLVLFFSLGTFLPITDLGTKDLLDCRHGQEWFRYWIALEKILGYILVPLWTLALAGLVR